MREPGVYEFAHGRPGDRRRRTRGRRPAERRPLLLNLAAPLTDGTQVVVRSGAAPRPADRLDGRHDHRRGLVNINTASATELETLSGIGEVLAAAIVEYRTENGPFASVDDLEDVSGIGPATLEEIRDQVTV